MLSLYMFLPAILWGHKGLGQDSTSRFSIVFSPALFVPVSVAAQGGLQYRMSKKWSLLAEVAIPIFYLQNDTYEEIKYRRTGVELKYRPNKIKNSNRYFSLQTTYLFRTLVDKDEGVVRRKAGSFIYEGATIKSPVLSNALKIGFETPVSKRFFADAFIGMGLRIIFNKYQSKNFRLTSIEPPKDSFPLLPEEGWRFDYTLTRFHFTAGLRLGLRL
ncbi:MAG: hypothetical protein JWR72_1213 [Flavisolibacter sp.]|nr:hypothetical protein [Flavisolibacter sp.]